MVNMVRILLTMVIPTLKPSMYKDCDIYFHWMTNQINFNEAWSAMLIRLITFSLRTVKEEMEKWKQPQKMFSVQASFFSLTVYLQFTVKSDNQFLLQSALCTLTAKRKSQQKKQQIIQSLKVGRHIFWTGEIAFLALMQLPWPCTGTPFFAALGTNWQMRGLRRAVPRVVLCRTRS